MSDESKRKAEEREDAGEAEAADKGEHAGNGEHVGGESRHDVAAEPDTTPTVRIFTYMGLLAVIVFVVIVGLWQAFKQLVRGAIYDQELSVVSKDLIELQARDRERLAGYAVRDEKAGVYSIPVRRGIDKLLANPELIAPRRPDAGTPGAASDDAGAAAPTPATGAARTGTPGASAAPRAPAPPSGKGEESSRTAAGPTDGEQERQQESPAASDPTGE